MNPIIEDSNEEQQPTLRPARRPWSTPRVILEELRSGTKGGPVTTANFPDFHSSPSIHTGPAS